MSIRELTESEANPYLGLSEKEKKNYSLVRAINFMAERRPLEGLEKEASDEIAKRTGQQPRGFYVPADISMNHFELASGDTRAALRALNVTTSTAGGFLVPTETASMIELLRNSMAVTKLGARLLPNLRGHMAIPRQTGGATAYWLDEMSAVPESQQTFGQLALTPKRLAACTIYTRQLLAQSSVQVESLVREDMMATLAVEKDRAAIDGAGAAGEPLGIMNTTGVNSVTFGGAPTWADAVNFETLVSSDNISLDNTAAYLTSPAARGVWKTTEKSTSTGIYLWHDGTINGYPALASNQIPGDKMIFGRFSDLIIADWDNFDVTVDSFTLAASGQIRVIIHNHTDCGVRHAAAFAISTDSAAQ